MINLQVLLSQSEKGETRAFRATYNVRDSPLLSVEVILT